MSARASQGKDQQNAAPDVPGARAFTDAFRATFELCYSSGWPKVSQATKECPPQEDPVERSRVAEDALLKASAMAAHAAALAVAAAARVAAEARSRISDSTAL